MSLKLNSSGGGSVTLQEPVTASNRTLTLPDATGSLITASLTLLGTVTTTSGATQTISGLDLTPYSMVFCVLDNVSATGATTMTIGGVAFTGALSSVANGNIGYIMIDLNNGIFASNVDDLANTVGISGVSTAYTGRISVTNASTSIAFGAGGASTFDAGTIRVYGVK